MSTVPAPRPLRTTTQPARPPLTLVADRFTLSVPASAHHMDGFREWATSDDFPERVRVTFLDGEIVLDMSNEEINSHVAVKTEITRVVGTLVMDTKAGKFYADGVLLTNAQASLSNNPDALFLGRETIDSGAARLLPRKGAEHLYREIEWMPDWVLEVVSDGSVTKDTVRLREAYHRAGVREYWLIDARGEVLSFTILTARKTGFVAAPVKEGWTRSKVFGRSFRLTRSLDEFGLWEYTLEVRAE